MNFEENQIKNILIQFQRNELLLEQEYWHGTGFNLIQVEWPVMDQIFYNWRKAANKYKGKK